MGSLFEFQTIKLKNVLLIFLGVKATFNTLLLFNQKEFIFENTN